MVHWSHLAIILLVSLILSILLLQEYENFRPRRDVVLYRQCERGTVATDSDKCCPEDQYDLMTGKCKSGECTTNRSKWLQLPICRQSQKGIIQSYGDSISSLEEFNNGAATPAAMTTQEYLSTAELDKLDLCGEGLPCTKLRLKEPVPKLSMYKKMLITLKGSPSDGDNSFGFYIHKDVPYLVQPIERFNEYEHNVLPLEVSVWSELEYNGRKLPNSAITSGWERIEDQTWYSQFNPLVQYNGKLLKRVDGLGAWAYINDGKPYALWGKDCNVQPQTIDANNQVLALLPTGNTFHHFSLAYKQPWYKSLLPECKQNEQVLAHF